MRSLQEAAQLLLPTHMVENPKLSEKPEILLPWHNALTPKFIHFTVLLRGICMPSMHNF